MANGFFLEENMNHLFSDPLFYLLPPCLPPALLSEYIQYEQCVRLAVVKLVHCLFWARVVNDYLQTTMSQQKNIYIVFSIQACAELNQIASQYNSICS